MVQSYVLPWFQSTSPRWGRRIRITRLRMRFNPRPTRGATSANNARAYTNVFQSTPPHEGRHHPPIRCVRSWCFNPRPHAGGDSSSSITGVASVSFQSTPPRGGRHVTKIVRIITAEVSIHAPARGATQVWCRLLQWHKRFNPRPRAGGDNQGSVTLDIATVSIHAPARGATFYWGGLYVYVGVSIHAPARGATVCKLVAFKVKLVSIHAPARGRGLKQVWP